MSSLITFYDIPGNAWSKKAWSPNCWKARYALNMKGIPHKTVWVEYPDIEPEMKKIGAKPTDIRDGSPLYTLPAIYDPSTGAVISDSFLIVQYLEKQYPSSVVLLPEGCSALQLAFRDALDRRVRYPALLPLLLLANVKQLSPESGAYFKATREKMFGKPLEEIVPQGDRRASALKTIAEGLSVLSGWLDANGEGKLFVMGEKPSFVDLEIAGNLLWARTVCGKDSDIWHTLEKADEGRWVRLLTALAKWETVV